MANENQRMTHPGEFFTVLTGDIIESRRLGGKQRKQLARTLRIVFDDLVEKFQYQDSARLSVFRGDSWQIFLPDPAWGLHFAVLFSTGLRTRGSLIDAPFKTKIGMAIDTVDFLDNSEIGASDGKAFQKSGEALEEIGRGAVLSCRFPESLENVCKRCLVHTVTVADYLLRQWTDRQAQAIHLMLGNPYGHYPTQSEISAHWRPGSISQPVVHKHLKSAHWSLCRSTLDNYREIVREVLNS
jgi:hypothetical protein